MVMPLKFLLPAKDVWGKVMFLHLSVILFTGRALSQHNHRSHDQRGVFVQGISV